MTSITAPLHVSEESWHNRRPPQDIVHFQGYTGDDTSPNSSNWEITLREGNAEQKFHIEAENINIHQCEVVLNNVLQAPKLPQVKIKELRVNIKNCNLQPKGFVKRCLSVPRGLKYQGKKSGIKVKSTRQSANLSQIISPPKISPIPLSLSNVPKNTKYRNIDVIKFNQLINNKLSPASPAIIDTGRCPFCFTFDEKPTSSVSILQEHLLRFHGPRPNATKLPKVVVFI